MTTIELPRGRFLRLANSARRSLRLAQPGVALVEAFSDASISISQSW
jgi:hypothetical protein